MNEWVNISDWRGDTETQNFTHEYILSMASQYFVEVLSEEYFIHEWYQSEEWIFCGSTDSEKWGYFTHGNWCAEWVMRFGLFVIETLIQVSERDFISIHILSKISWSWILMIIIMKITEGLRMMVMIRILVMDVRLTQKINVIII